MKAIEQKDELKIQNTVETTFAARIIKNFANAGSLKYVEPKGNGKAFLVDKMFVKGMNIDRTQNDTNFDYLYYSKLEKFGLRAFVHKYNAGEFHYYIMRDFKESHFKKLNNELHETDPDAYYHLHRQIQNELLKYKRTMFEKEFQLILRVVLQLTDGKVGKFTSPTEKLNYNEGYTGNHIAVFECMLRSPPVFSLIDNTYE